MNINPDDAAKRPDTSPYEPDDESGSAPGKTLKHLLDRSNVFVFTADYATRRLPFLSKSLVRVLGYAPEAWQRAGTPALSESIHPEDRTSYLEIRKCIRRTVRESSPGRRMALRFAYTLRYLANDGRTVFLAFYQSPVEIDDAGNPVRDLVIATDITPFCPRRTAALQIVDTDQAGGQGSRTVIFPREGAVNFSEREIEVLRLVATGKKSQEIADRLFISYNTVTTHRKNLMKKAGVKRALELVRFARHHGLLLD